MVKPGEIAPDFIASTESGEAFALSSMRGRKVVLYFYPKDNTPGCTQEACDFRDAYALLNNKNVAVIGVSTDNVKSHSNFKEKHSLPFTLLADPKRELVQQYGVWVEKKNYGRSYMGIARTTIIIDEQGVITDVFDNVKVKGHVDAVLTKV